MFPTHPRRKDVAIGIALLLLPVAFFPELIFAGKALIRSDLNWLHYPLRVLVSQNWRSGTWPLWDPYVLCGVPLLGEAQVGVLYLPNLLFMFPIPAYVASSLFALLHLGLAALFTYLLARTLGCGRAGSTLAGLSFGFGGVLTAQVTQLNIMSGLVWIPLVLYLVTHASQRQSVWWAILAGGALALQILTAQPQTVFYSAVLLFAYVVLHTHFFIRSTGWSKQALRPSLTVAVAGMVGLGLAAAQLLPTFELWTQSVRSHGVSYDQLILYSMHPLQLLELLIPNLFGNPVVGYGGLGDFCEYHAYLGLVPLLLALTALWRLRADPQVRSFFLVLVFALVLCFGGYTPLYSILQYVPGFDLFRVPARWIALASLVLALLAGLGLDALLMKDKTAQVARTLLWLSGAVGLLALAAIAFVWQGRQSAAGWLTTPGLSKEVQRLLGTALRSFLSPGKPNVENWLPGLAPWITIPGLVLLVELSVIIGVLAACIKGKLGPRSVSYALVGLTLLDLLVTEGSTVTQLGGADYWQYDNYIIEMVRREAGHYRADVLGTQALHSVDPQDPAEPAHRAIYWLMRYNPVMYDIASPTGYYSPLRLGRFEDFNRDVPVPRAEDLMSEKVVLTWGQPTRDQEASLRLIRADGMLHVYENPDALPRAYLAHQIEAVPDREAALLRLTKSNFDPTQSTVVEGPPPKLSFSGQGISAVDIRRDSAQRVVVKCESSQDGILVLTDSYYPGWRAFVDGKEATILQANYLFRAVPVPAGKHTVAFVYRADSFEIGLVISGTTMILIAFLGIAHVRVKRKAGRLVPRNRPT